MPYIKDEHRNSEIDNGQGAHNDYSRAQECLIIDDPRELRCSRALQRTSGPAEHSPKVYVHTPRESSKAGFILAPHTP